MIQCSHCMEWFHNECVGVEKNTDLIAYSCLTCRLTPVKVSQIMQTVLDLKILLDNVAADSLASKNAMQELRNDFIALKEENTKLQGSLDIMSQTMKQDNKMIETLTTTFNVFNVSLVYL